MTATTLLDPPSAVLAPTERRPSLLADSLVFARRNIEHIRQIPEKLIDVTIQPIMFVLLFAYVFGGAIHVTGGNYREYLIGGILVQSLAFGLMGPAISIAGDLAEGAVDRFRTLPARRAAYLVGHFVSEFAGVALGILILLATGFAIGWRTHTDVWHVAAGVGLLVVFASAVIWLGTYLGMLVRSADAVQGIVFVAVFPVTFLSNAFVPIESMPDVLQWVAGWNPVSAIAAAVRELFGNPVTPVTKHTWPMDHPVAAAWIFAVGLLAASVPAALARYRTRTTD